MMGESGQLDPPGEAAQNEDSGEAGTEYVRLSDRSTIPPRKPAAAAVLPERFGRYQIVRCLGQGAMGAVYLATDTQLDRQAALKIPKFTQDQDDELIERFYREARAAATVRHPNLCPVYDAGQIDGIHYLSMAFIEGRTLSEVLADSGRPSRPDAVAILLRLAKALDAAHGRGVIHRDLKPANVIIDNHGEPIVMDFGLARRLNAEDSRLTQHGLVMGSPAYMSPEQIEGDLDKTGPACDIYSLGVIAYELLCGQVPFQGSIAAVMGQIVTTPVPRLRSRVPDIEPELEAICLKMMAKRPEDRFATMRDVVTALESYAAGRPTGIPAVPREPAAGAPGSLAAGHPSRGIVVAPWMLATFLGIVIVGFGITWHLVRLALDQRTGTDEIKLSQAELQGGTAKVVLNGQELTSDQLKEPLELPAGSNTITVMRDGGDARTRQYESDKDDPLVLVPNDDSLMIESGQRRIAKWVVTAGGRVNVGDGFVSQVGAIPKGKLQIAEIDLTGVTSIPEARLRAIERLVNPVRRLVLSKSSISDRRLKELRASLASTTVEVGDDAKPGG